MIAGLWTYSLKPGAYDDFKNYFNQQVYGLLTGAHGFKRLSYYYDSAANQVVQIIEWDTEEDAANARANPEFPQIMGGLGNYLTAPPVRMAYQVVQGAWTTITVPA